MLDPARFLAEFAERIYHVNVRDVKLRLDGERSILGSHLDFGDHRRRWEYVSPGHGDVDFEAIIRVLNRIGYDGPLSVEWEDFGMDREHGARDALEFVRSQDFPPSEVSFRRRDETPVDFTGRTARRAVRPKALLANRPRRAGTVVATYRYGRGLGHLPAGQLGAAGRSLSGPFNRHARDARPSPKRSD